MRNSSGIDSNNFRSKFSYNDEQQHLDPIAEYEDELDLEYAGEDDLFGDNETVDEEEYQYFDNNDRYVIENRKRYIKPAKSRETTAPPTRAKYIYKKKEIENCTDRPHKKHSSKASSSNNPLSPVTSKSKVEPPRWSKLPNPASSFQRGPKGRKPEMPFNALMSLNALREKMFGDSMPSTPPLNMPTTDPPLSSTSTHNSKSKRRNTIATEQIHHDSGDGPSVIEPFKMNLSELLKITDESSFGGTMIDNEVVANLVNEISTMQSENKRKINEIDRQRQGMDSYYPGSLNINTENFRQKMERTKNESDQNQPPSSTYQPFTHHSLGAFSQNFLEGLNSFPCKKNSSTQTNLGLEDAYLSDHDFKPDSETKYDEACGQDMDNDNQNWNGDDVSNIVSSSKEDLSELRNLQKTKRMICELINKEIEKIAKMKNLDMSVSRRFLLQDRESLCNEDFRKTRLNALNNLQNEIKKLITLETVEE